MGTHAISFLQHLRRRILGSNVLVWDKHPAHKREMVLESLGQQSPQDAHEFPTCAPELNPAEFVWAQVSEVTTDTAPRNGSEPEAIVRRGIARTSASRKCLWVYLKAPALPWNPNRTKHRHSPVRNR